LNTRSLSLLALCSAVLATLGSQLLCYGLVYPAAARASKLPLVAGLALGASITLLSCLVSLISLRRAAVPAEKFFALLSAAVSGFLLFVVLAGFGIPQLLLGLKD
jgi:hypothetical protein